MMMMEGSSVPEVRPMMHLLRESWDRGDTIADHILEMFKDVYQNFTSIHTATISILENCGTKFHQGTDLPKQYRWMTESVGLVITFCRWQLQCIVNAGGLINNTSTLLLEKNERKLLIIIKGLTDHLSREELHPDRIDDLRRANIGSLKSEIQPVYEAVISRHEASLMPSNLLIGSETILEFLNQVHQDLHHKGTAAEERKTMRGYLVLLRYYFDFTTDIINGEEMKDFFISSQLVGSKMAYYSILSYYSDSDSLEKFASSRHPIESDIRLACLSTAIALPQNVSSSISTLNDELLPIYVNCIQDNLSDLLKDEAFTNLRSLMTDQLKILQSGFSFLMILQADSGRLTAAGHVKLSDIRVRFQALVRNVGSLILSCFSNDRNKSITPALSDFIENVNHLKEESIEVMESSVTEVSGKMKLLHQCGCRGETLDDVLQMLKYVHRNFTSIHKTGISLLANLGEKFHQGCDLPDQYRWMRDSMGFVITFCRWQLKSTVKEHGIINKTSVLLLEKFERNLLIIVKGLTDFLAREEIHPDRIDDLRRDHIGDLESDIQPVYEAVISRHEASLKPSNLLVGTETILEFLNQVHQDLQHKGTAAEERKTMRGYLVLLRYYFEFTTDIINGEEMKDFFISSQLVGSKMAYYSLSSYYSGSASLEKFASSRHRIESDIRVGCLSAAIALPQNLSTSIPAMNDDLLSIYVNCIQDNLADILKDGAFTNLRSLMTDQLKILQSGFSFLMILHADSGRLTAAGHVKLSDIRVRFQALVRNVGSLILSCFNNEMNISITPALSDFIENVNLLKEESIEVMEGSVTEVSGKMSLLNHCGWRGETLHDLHQMLKYVYRNFTSIHKAGISLLANLKGKFHQGCDLPDEYRWMRESMGFVITFCRWQLKFIVEDGLINNKSALLLENFERTLLIIVKGLTDYLSREEFHPGRINDLRSDHIGDLESDIQPVYEAVISRHEVSLKASNLLIGSESILEFLNQVHQDLHHKGTAAEERETMRGYLVLLRYYFDFSADRINVEEMNDFLISSHLVGSKMAYYSLLSYYSSSDSLEKFASTRLHIESDIRVGCLRATVVFPQHVSTSIPAMNRELLIVYVNCIQDNLSDLLKDGDFTNRTSSMINQFTILRSGLSLLKFLLASSEQLNAADQEKQSDLSVRFQTLVGKVGSLAVSCFNDEMNGSIASSLFDLIENVNLMKEESIEIMEGNVTEVCGKMNFLNQCCGHGETWDDLQQMLKCVYRNFTSIHTACISLIENCGRKFHQGSSDLPYQYRWMRESMGLVITFCRWQLINRMVNGDGLMNDKSALMLEKIERNLLIVIKGLTDYLSREELDLSIIYDLRRDHLKTLNKEIETVYQAVIIRNGAPSKPSYLWMGSESILQFLNQVHQDFHHQGTAAVEERKTMRGYLLLLRYFLDYCTTTDEMNDFLISSQLVGSNMASYSFLSFFNVFATWKESFASIWQRREADIRLGCLQAVLLLPQHFSSSSIPTMNDELLIIYVNCIQDNLSDLLRDEAFTDLTSPMLNQFTILQSGMSFLKFLHAGSAQLNADDQENLSDLRVRFQDLVRNVGSLAVLCFNNEMNGSLAPMLSDFIENVNLIKEESAEIVEGSVTEVSGKMNLLRKCGCRGETLDDLHQMLKYVHRNFTSIHKAGISLLANLGEKFHQGCDLPAQYRWMRESMGFVITFCRWQLKFIVMEDGLINNKSALLLEKFEGTLLIIVKGLTDYLSREEFHPDQIDVLRRDHIGDLQIDIQPVYEAVIGRHEAYLMSSNLLIGSHESILEFLNQVHQDLQHKGTAAEERKTMRGYLVLLRYYFEFTTDRINGREMKDFLISSELVGSKMAYYSLSSYYSGSASLEKFASIRHRIESDIRLGCLKADLVLPQHVSSSIPAMNDELLVIYVNCIYDNLSDLLQNEAFAELASTVTDKFKMLRRVVSLLMILLADSRMHTTADHERLSDMKVRFQDFLRNVGSLIVSCFSDDMKQTITSALSYLMKAVDLLKEETIEDMCFIAFGRQGQEALGTHQLHFLIILIENLEGLIDSKSNLIMTMKDQSDAVYQNLVLFRSFINNIRGNSTASDGSESIVELDYSEKEKQITTLAEKIQLLRNNLQLDIDQINGEELSELLISVEVSAFAMSCHYSFRRYGEVHWWKVYVQTKDHLDSHMRVGILRAAVLSLEGSSTLPLSDGLLMGYLDCILDNMNELVQDEAGDQMKGLLESLHQELSLLVQLLIKHDADQEKLSDIKLSFQTLLRNIGSVLCSCFTNRLSNLVTDQSIGVADLLDKMNFLQDETRGFQYTVILHRIRQESSKVHLPGFFDLLLRNWKDFMDCESDTDRYLKDHCQPIHEILILFRSFVQNFTTSPTGDEEDRKLYNLITEAGYVAEYLLDSFAVEACPVSCTSRWISEFTEHIKRIKGILVENRKNTSDKEIPALADVMVGFEVEMKSIRTRLYNQQLLLLDVISIVGMPGSGKTTLARKVYEDPSTAKHFDVYAWCIVSQEYNKKELLLTILGSKLELTDLTRRKSETELSVMVHKELKGRRYFIVLDDVWAIDAFMGLKNFFPDDKIGSRIMLTSRSKVIGLQAKYYSQPIELGFLTDDESWDLLERKVYPQGRCPLELCQLGKQIAKKCRGLPLAIVVVAGFLAKSVQKHDLWEQVAGNLNSSYLAHDLQTQWMGPLELSYKGLPDHLKPLFLYFGAFPEDEEIPTDKLMWLWIAEGFLQQVESGSLEMQAEESLKDLIDRNLVMVAKRSSGGRVKACHVHDLLRDMCVAKAKQEKFMEQINAYQELPDRVLYQRRLSVFLKRDTPTSSNPLIPYKYFPVVSVSPPLRTLLFFNMQGPKIPSEDPNPAFSGLKFSRVIHCENTTTNVDDIMKLLNLRYISIRTDCKNITESLSNIHNLETLIIKGIRGEIVLPRTIWEMVKLRHLHVNDRASFQDASQNSAKLENLSTLSTPAIDSGEVKKFIERVPNVQKLRCILNNEHSYSNRDINHCYDLEALDKLESLKASYSGIVRSPGQFKLPLSLRKLSLSMFRLQWSQVSMFQKLPKLEVLKLCSDAVQDDSWDTGDDKFPKLKILKLENLNIEIWNASGKNFPCLEKLVLERCKQLEEIPFGLGDINCLQKMEVIWCSSSAAESAKEIEEEQKDAGNVSLNVYIYPPHQLDSQSSS